MPYEQLDLSNNKPVLSWANHELDNREAQMANNVASLPFVFKHVALMPDVHLGKGALVGSVIATKDAVIPAAVGVDIGCFTGDTEIPLVDGKHYKIADLANQQRSIYIYACTDSGKIVCAEAIARKTRSNATLVKVVLDNNCEIRCTPDHQFMLRDGSYREAKDLQSHDSLMPFYSKIDKDGYSLIQQNYSGRWQKAHWIVARSGILGEIPRLEQQRTVIHQYEPGYNHKVIDVVPLTEREDVYCLSVPKYNNFALSAGVFVHNCGMAAVKMPFTGDRLEGKLKKIRHQIERSIPVGRWGNKRIEKQVTNWQGWRDFKELHPGVQDLDNKAQLQMGSLGGGNHFIELCLDTENYVWLMLHSGSRHIGNKLAQCHISTGKKLAELANLSLPDPDLAYFVAGTPEFEAYWRDLQWAQDYARFNRDVMMERFKRIIQEFVTGGKEIKPLLSVNCHHNYAEKEVHFGEDVYVTRKGAVRAQQEDYGIIPGSMGTKSYIVKGKGNHDSYCSCFIGETQILTNKGLMLIKDVYDSVEPIELVSYNEKSHKFELKPILESSVREVEVNSYSISQTRRRQDNILISTSDHPIATYEKGKLTYQEIENLANRKGGVIIPTQVNLVSDLALELQNANFYYLLGVILSDGTIHYQARKNAPEMDNRPRGGKYMQGYIRIYQSATEAKQPFIDYLEKSCRNYTSQVSRRISPGRVSQIKGREVQGNALVEITISDLDFVEKVIDLLPQLPKILISNYYLALHFIAGYLDGDGSYNQGIISISIGKETMFSYLVCALLSLGVVYKVYRNRNNYVVEFRDNILMLKLQELCQRLAIATPPKRLYGDKLLLASSLIGGDLSCRDLTSYAKQEKMINVAKFEDQDLDSTLAMNRVFKINNAGKQLVYNFTVQDNHNYIVFTKYYTPVLVHNCSHGAGRLMSRTKAKKEFTVEDVIEQTQGVECRKDSKIIDEIPGAYKPIEEVMANQSDLVEVVATLKQVVCVKG